MAAYFFEISNHFCKKVAQIEDKVSRGGCLGILCLQSEVRRCLTFYLTSSNISILQ